MTIKSYYNDPKYEGLETDYRILSALEELTESDITDKISPAYAWWINGGDEEKIIKYIDTYYPDWTEYAPLNWGTGGIAADRTTY